MPEASHIFGSDLQLSATGDLLLASGVTETQQRVIRRLMTNLDAYLWHPAYGAGLPSQVGKKANTKAITAIVRSQIFQEASVAQSPPPRVNVAATPGGSVFCTIQYTDATTSQPVTLTVPLS